MKISTKNIVFLLVAFAVLLVALPVFAEGGHAVAEHGGEAAKAAHGQTHGFPWKNWAFNMFNFLVFVGILWWKAVPAIQDFFKNRREELISEIDAAKELREEAKRKLEEFEKKIASLEKERQEIMDEYHAQGARERDRLIEEAKKQVEKMRKDAEMIIAQETRKAVLAIEKQAVDEAINLATTKLSSKIDDSAQVGLVDNFVNELRAMD